MVAEMPSSTEVDEVARLEHRITRLEYILSTARIQAVEDILNGLTLLVIWSNNNLGFVEGYFGSEGVQEAGMAARTVGQEAADKFNSEVKCYVLSTRDGLNWGTVSRVSYLPSNTSGGEVDDSG